MCYILLMFCNKKMYCSDCQTVAFKVSVVVICFIDIRFLVLRCSKLTQYFMRRLFWLLAVMVVIVSGAIIPPPEEGFPPVFGPSPMDNIIYVLFN